MIRAMALALLMPLPAVAQSTAAEILGALDAPTSELEQLMEVLNGPNEEKALTAMRLMLASGDAAMQRLALRAGLSSTSGVARGVALEAYLKTQPTLIAFASVEGEEEVNSGFARWMNANGSLSSDRTGSFPIPIGPYLEDQNCFGSPTRPNDCFNRLGGTEVSFFVGAAWGTARLNDSGELVGSISHSFSSNQFTGPISLTIPLLGQLQ
ncbi:hypothetical protein [Flavimaricola marinus]|uniref:Uncharacterized protein n=1 Tax=Flavimaricola marinus TaxID=1819565 RepID=A0A238LGI4_9RHOB|nr:hypothetical protein [Flavimaricola marinus]SMY08010.1 hypothetical protein LOM8899_02156 [Flavimaricola marinus]